MPERRSVIVLGLGIAGSSIAATLAQRGFRVTGIEQFSPLHERGSSHGDTRIFRRVPHEGDVYVKLADASYDGWQRWSRLANDMLFVECGGIDAGPAISRMVQAAEELCVRYGQPFEALSGLELNRRYPYFKLPSDWRVIYHAASGFVRPDATRVFLHAMAREYGAKLLHDTAVLGLEDSPGAVRVRTAQDTFVADILVIAAGGWLPELVPELQLDLSVERRVIAWFQQENATDVADGRLPIFCMDADGGWYGMPTPDGRVKIGHDKHLRQQIDPNQLPMMPDAEDAAMLSRCTRDYLVGFEGQPSEMKSCIYSSTRDHHFLIDRHPMHANVLIFSCCSGHGFKYAPAYGEIAANLINGDLSAEYSPFRLERGDAQISRFSQ